ncbi:hypothetical protein P3X46_011484 [Hevea brasiliensis]|uniref:BAG domain-containing protein n=1 Tax=Hevea brasiliensis TaxID=3981 RepID=A0ABQ9MB96_HEVBR|nr:uncharacterized protein LOC110659880 [Hevea brasiliensis]KAJ9176139.1 hypothetical protein P3X46_011484 [Hevea brasiliensis]
MVDNPFFKNHFSYPCYCYPYSPSVRRVPVHRHTTPVQKVVEIPVRHVDSEPSRLDSALKIQQVFRGILVRKSVKKIAAIKSEVNEIEKRILMKENVEMIRRDSKERLKVNEMLMNLLFRLDSVPGVDSVVRDCRRTVVKTVIRLQEMVDAIVADSVDRVLEVEELAKNREEDADQTPQDGALDMKGIFANSASNSNSLENAVDQTMELQNHVECVPNCDCVEKMPEAFEETSTLQSPEQQNSTMGCESRGNVELAEAEVGENANVEDDVSVSGNECAESVDLNREESQADSSADPEDDLWGNHENAVAEHKEEHVKEQSYGVKEEVSRKNRDLVERIMEDNEKMMGLMTKFFERNEMQTRLLRSLSQRVEQLERALMCKRSKRNKRRGMLVAWRTV